MSSFRPDSGFAPPKFIPLGFIPVSEGAEAFAHEEAEGIASLESSQFADSGAGQRLGLAELPSTSGPTAEEWAALEAFEQAAFERGVESSREDAARTAQVFQSLEDAARQLEHAATTSVGANRERVLELASLIAARWVGDELAADGAAFGLALDQAIEACGPQAETRILLNPDDLDLLRETDPERVARWTEAGSLVLVPESDLARGDFEVDAGSVKVDGRASAIVDTLRDALSMALDSSAVSAEDSEQ